MNACSLDFSHQLMINTWLSFLNFDKQVANYLIHASQHAWFIQKRGEKTKCLLPIKELLFIPKGLYCIVLYTVVPFWNFNDLGST